MEPVVLVKDDERLIYRLGGVVYKQRRLGLEHEYRVGCYVNRLNDPRYVKSLTLTDCKLSTEYVTGESWLNIVNQSKSLQALDVLNNELLAFVEGLPFTHYDLHMNNVIVKNDHSFKLIDFGLSALPAHEWTNEIRYAQASPATLSCGLLPAVFDPGYDRLSFVYALYKQALHFKCQELLRDCTQLLKQARFDNLQFPGRENLLSQEFMNAYGHLFYRDRIPLLRPGTTVIGYDELLQAMNRLQVDASEWLARRYRVNEQQANLLLTSNDQHYLHDWVLHNEERVYDPLYAYKRKRISHRRVPTFKKIRELI